MAVFFSSDFPNRYEVTRRVAAGSLVSVARAVYSDEVRAAPADIVERCWAKIVGNLMPGAVVTYRSGLGYRPQDGVLFVSHERERELVLPGLIVVSDGLKTGALPGDFQLAPGLYGASEQRVLLDNQAASRARAGRPPRTLSRAELHDRIVSITQSRSAQQRATLLDAVREQAEDRGYADRVESIEIFFQSAAGDRPTVDTGSPAMRAAQKRGGYDDRRARQFRKLADDLRARAPKLRPEQPGPRRNVLPFFEAYFSNYIEGTEFTVEEAVDIAIRGHIPAERPADAHDIVGTFRIVNDRDEMNLRLTDVGAWLDALKRRHAAVMEGRPEALPGRYKGRANRAGSTLFVDPELVDGTLRVGFEMLQSLDDPFARAVFTMYFVSEVHPFSDGNGRTVRMMMNGELISAGQNRIIIPTVLRRDYTTALTGVSANDHIDGLVSVLDFAQRYTGQVDFTSIENGHVVLTETNAYLEPNDADNQGLRLVLPSDLAPYRVPRAGSAEPRVGAGTPSGGEFAARSQSEDEIALGQVGEFL